MAIELDMKEDIASRLVMEVHCRRHREWTWRVKIGMWLMGIAARIMWVDMEVVEDESAEIIGSLLKGDIDGRD